MIEMAMELEENGNVFYTKFSEAVDDNEGRSLLLFLAGQEREHLEFLRKVREEEKELPSAFTIPKAEVPVLRLENIFGDFSGEVDAASATEYAIGVEQLSMNFYQLCADRVGVGKLQKFFEDLVEVERKHKELLEENLGSLKNEGTWSGYLPILEG